MNKDELDPHPGNLRKHEAGSLSRSIYFTLTRSEGLDAEVMGSLANWKDHAAALEMENEALRKENQMLRDQLASISAIKNEEP